MSGSWTEQEILAAIERAADKGFKKAAMARAFGMKSPQQLSNILKRRRVPGRWRDAITQWLETNLGYDDLRFSGPSTFRTVKTPEEALKDYRYLDRFVGLPETSIYTYYGPEVRVGEIQNAALRAHEAEEGDLCERIDYICERVYKGLLDFEHMAYEFQEIVRRLNERTGSRKP